MRIERTGQFKRDFKRALKQGRDAGLLEAVIRLLISGQPLPAKYRDHALTGSFKGFRELHIQPDWLLEYQLRDDALVLVLVRLGSHSELLGL